ncbi:MAG: UDP-4-amino-4,6-dideoxy-N-acetyl-beta-L-altrosamine transaminase [Oxalobacteraceae bacterium]|nr:MAG: UDP-4-amino-4,6-dideoxy-N-acetyl-beta-L-altrosamine transaminase [Oxalobacteraceae bacterium]
MIPYGRQSISQADIDAVTEVLTSDWLTQGPAVPRFEQAVASHCGATHAVAANSATGALHIACLALGVGPGDVVWTSPISFVASGNCARYCGADVDFVDIDPRTANMSPAALEAKLQAAEQKGRLPKVVIPVHLAGQSCDMAAIHALGQRYGFRIIEDASHAVGGSYQSQPIGNCRLSDITVFSFHPVKVITSAEGGMALTQDAELASRMQRLRSHGITRDAALMVNPPDGPWYYEQLDLGYNYRMTDVHAALGLSQMSRLDAFVARRHEIARRYDADLANLPLVTPWQHPDNYSGFHLYYIRLRLDQLAKSHLQVFNDLRAGGIGVNLHYIPIYRQPDFARYGRTGADYPEAEKYYAEAISLPMYPAMTDEQQGQVIDTISGVLR